MSATKVHGTSRDAAGNVRMNLEVQIIPRSAPLPGLRIVQFTPPGSATSITFGLGLTAAAPGSAEDDGYPRSLALPRPDGPFPAGRPRHACRFVDQLIHKGVSK